MDPHQSTISGVQLNCQSINNKVHEIKAILQDFTLDFAAFSETWITHHEPKFFGYHSYWKNRIGSLGGGVGFLIRCGITHSILNLAQFPGGVLEIQAIKIYLKNNQNLTLLNLYNPNIDL